MHKRRKYRKTYVILGIIILLMMLIPRSLVAIVVSKVYVNTKYSYSLRLRGIEYSSEKQGYIVRYEENSFSSIHHVLVTPKLFPVIATE